MAGIPELFGLTFGPPSKTGATVVAMSRSASNISLTVGVRSYTITLSAVGADRGVNDGSGSQTLGYTGNISIIYDAPLTSHNWSATQDGVSKSGTILSGPGRTGNFAIALTTCFNNSTTDSEIYTSAWDFMDWYRRLGPLPLVAIHHADDIIYADGFGATTILGFDDPNGKTPLAFARGTRTKYDFAFAYGNWFGICGPVWHADSEWYYWDAAFRPAFRRLKDNCSWGVQVGDHEFYDNEGWTGGQALNAVPGPFNATTNGRDGNGIAVWDQIMGPLMGTPHPSPSDSIAMLRYSDYGSLRIIAPDPITRAVDGVSCFGTNQIDDALDLANGTQWFTAWVLGGTAGRGMPIYTSGHTGFAYKSENVITSEYNRVYVNTGQSPKSLMDNPRTNGTLGNMVVFRGDWHGGACFRWYAPASTGIAAENWYEVCMNTVNSAPAAGTLYAPEPEAMVSDYAALVGGCIKTGQFDTNKFERSLSTIIEVYQDLPTPEMVVRQYDIYKAHDGEAQDGFWQFNYGDVTDDAGNTWRCMFEKKFPLYLGNTGFDLSAETWSQPIDSSGGRL